MSENKKVESKNPPSIISYEPRLVKSLQKRPGILTKNKYMSSALDILSDSMKEVRSRESRINMVVGGFTTIVTSATGLIANSIGESLRKKLSGK